MTLIRGKNQFLRSTSISRNNYLIKGRYYSEMAHTKTYESYNKMSAIKQVNIGVTPSPEDSARLLDVTIALTPANTHWLRTSLEGTNSAGDIGIAPSIAYQHVNLFNGSEQLNLKLKGAYEFITNSENASLLGQTYYEFGGEAGLSFPLFLFPWLKKSWRQAPTATTQINIGLNNQHRPQYTRQFFNATISYSWATKRNRLRHGLDFLDVNYVRMPWASDEFTQDYLNDSINPLLKESYKDQLIARTAYTLSFSNGRRFNLLSPTYTLRGSVEVAGALPNLATSLAGSKAKADGKKTFMGVQYAEYVKATFEYTRTLYFSKQHSLAYHAVLGVACPYSNSEILPFERRFFSGGANSVRGWNTRALGPGSYQRGDKKNDFVNQTGDLKLDLNIENRNKVSEYIEIATFIDAGNIWTLKDYPNQQGGQFKLNKFYKEIALSYGLGIRFDLGFLLLRLDAGMQAYDPSRPEGDRLVIFRPQLSRAAWHFGIGYPF